MFRSPAAGAVDLYSPPDRIRRRPRCVSEYNIPQCLVSKTVVTPRAGRRSICCVAGVGAVFGRRSTGSVRMPFPSDGRTKGAIERQSDVPASRSRRPRGAVRPEEMYESRAMFYSDALWKASALSAGRNNTDRSGEKRTTFAVPDVLIYFQIQRLSLPGYLK